MVGCSATLCWWLWWVEVLERRNPGLLAACHKPLHSLPPRPRQADKDILEHIVYDFGDTGMMEALRPSIEEAFPIQSQVRRGMMASCTRQHAVVHMAVR